MVGSRVALGNLSNNFGQLDNRVVVGKAVGSKGLAVLKEEITARQHVELSRGRKMVALGRQVVAKGEEKVTADADRILEGHLLDVPRLTVEEITIDDDNDEEEECMEVDVDQAEDTRCNDLEYSESMFAHLRNIERSSPVTQHPPQVRRMLVDWLREVQEDWEINTDTLFLAVNLIDRYLVTKQGAGTSLNNLQLVGVTALLVACKVEEISVPVVTEFAWVTDDTYSPRQIRAMEQRLLQALGWNVTPALPSTFLGLIFNNLELNDSKHEERSLDYLKQGLLDSKISSMLPSLQAAAAIYLSTPSTTGPMLSRVAQASGWQAVQVLAAAKRMKAASVRNGSRNASQQ